MILDVNDSKITAALDKAYARLRKSVSRQILQSFLDDGAKVDDADARHAQELKSSARGKRKLILSSSHSPGDVTMLSAAIRDLHATYPGEYQTDVESACNEIYEGNPLITKLDKKDPDVVCIPMHYPLIHDSNEGSYHFIHGYRKYLEERIGRPIKQGKMKPDIYIRDEERGWVSAVEEITKDNRPFWIIDAGYKNDFTAKAWSFLRYQAVVNHFRNKIQFVQIGHRDHNHPELRGVINMVGQTDNRQLIRLIYHSIGILTPVSWPMVLAAGVPMKNQFPKNRACVVLSGGREPVQWQMYPNHQFLHTCGTMPCCDNGGCWKSRVVPIGDGDEKDKNNLCGYPARVDGQDIARCMANITVADVVRAIERYYDGGVFQYDPRKTMSYEYKNRDVSEKKDVPEKKPETAGAEDTCDCVVKTAKKDDVRDQLRNMPPKIKTSDPFPFDNKKEKEKDDD